MCCMSTAVAPIRAVQPTAVVTPVHTSHTSAASGQCHMMLQTNSRHAQQIPCRSAAMLVQWNICNACPILFCHELHAYLPRGFAEPSFEHKYGFVNVQVGSLRTSESKLNSSKVLS